MSMNKIAMILPSSGEYQAFSTSGPQAKFAGRETHRADVFTTCSQLQPPFIHRAPSTPIPLIPAKAGTQANRQLPK